MVLCGAEPMELEEEDGHREGGDGVGEIEEGFEGVYRFNGGGVEVALQGYLGEEET